MNKIIMDAQTVSDFVKKLEEFDLNKDEKWAIYGTGQGAELVFSALCKMDLRKTIKAVLDRDEEVLSGKTFHNIVVQTLSETYKHIDGIIIAAISNHEVIRERINDYIAKYELNKVKIIDIFSCNTKNEIKEYVKYIEKCVLRESLEFVSFDKSAINLREDDTKVIAWYLPQFHQIDINNRFHGQGFTEWTNTSRTLPLYTGHYQPHIPYDVGYYDLLNIDTFKRQIYLAKHYGVYGFCFHYYWFSGKRIMEKPLELFLEHTELEIPFCINWATENWTTLWEGRNDNIMMEQRLEAGDDEKFMDDILPYMKDSRYIKIAGRPVLVVYRVGIFPKDCVKKLFSVFRERAKAEGFPDLYILLTNSYGFDEDVFEWGADAIVEFPAHGMVHLTDQYRPKGYLNPYFKGTIRDVSTFMDNCRYMLEHKSQVYFRSALVSWDNTARKALSGGLVFHGFTPATFKKWLKDIILESKKIHTASENIVFVNSWNEWAEGSHLEPDMKYGYAFLQVVKDVIEEVRKNNLEKDDLLFV